MIVSVYSGRTLIAEKERPLRLLRDGRKGVAFRGVVYPLRLDNSIDIQGGSYRKVDTTVVVPANSGQVKGASSALKWHLDLTGHYAYLVLNGTELDVVRVSEMLAHSGVQVLRQGVCIRPADDGKLYDFFLRIESADPDLASTIDEVLSWGGRRDAQGGKNFRSTSSNEWSATELSDGDIVPFAIDPRIKPSRDALLAENARLRDELDVTRKRVSHQAKTHLQAEAEYAQHFARLTSELGELRDARWDISSSQGRRMEQLESAVLSKQALIETLNSAILESQQLAQAYSDERDALLESLEDREVAEHRLVNQLERAKRGAGRREEDLRVLFESLLPRASFVDDSIKNLLSLDDLRSVALALGKVCAMPNEVRAIPFASARPWFELHYSTGRADDGRLYFKHENHRICFLISFKSEQRAIVEILNRH